jgi:parallel beta-helix repeat protein
MTVRLALLLPLALTALAVLAAEPQKAGPRVLHVAPQGGDYSTIQAAVDAASPGDTILVADGTYHQTVEIARPHLTLRSEHPRGAQIVAPPSNHGIRLREGANYIVIDGFDITAPFEGISAHEEGMDHVLNHHTLVMNCHIHDCGGGGIGINLGDYRYIESNVIDNCAARAPWDASGISICVPIALDRKPGFHNVISGNIVFHNSNPPHGTDGNGIIIDTFRHRYSGGEDGAFPGSTLVENNVVYDNGGRGIHVFRSEHVVVRNNTVYHNNWDLTQDAWWAGELSCSDSSDVRWYNNIAVADSAASPHNTAVLDADSGRNVNRDNVWAGNLLFDSAKPGTQSLNLGTHADREAILAGNIFGRDPLFAAPGKGPEADFCLKAGSPAIGAARTADAPPDDVLKMLRDAHPDLGAYEFGATDRAPKQDATQDWPSPAVQ